MRCWLHLALIFFSFGLVWLRPNPAAEQQTQEKARRLLDSYYGRGHAQVTVTVRQGHGERTIRDQQFGEQAFVLGSQDRRESYRDSYSCHTRSEKLEVPRKLVVSQQQDWLETDVAVVVDRDPGPEIKPLLQAGLGLHPQSGDQIQVVRSLR